MNINPGYITYVQKNVVTRKTFLMSIRKGFIGGISLFFNGLLDKHTGDHTAIHERLKNLIK